MIWFCIGIGALIGVCSIEFEGRKAVRFFTGCALSALGGAVIAMVAAGKIQ